jgi:hypothetical protein
MAKVKTTKKDRQYNGQSKKSIVLFVLLCGFYFGHCIVCPSLSFLLWPLYCLSSFVVFTLTIVLSVLLCGFYFVHCIVCPSLWFLLWPLYCLSFFVVFTLTIVLVMLFLLQTLWCHKWEKTGLWWRQTEYLNGHLWHRYYETVNQVIVATERLLIIKSVVAVIVW